VPAPHRGKIRHRNSEREYLAKIPTTGTPIGKSLTDRYEFSVGIIVTKDPTATNPERLHYGEDPEMDIGD